MKLPVVIALWVISSASAWAQEETLVGDSFESGGFGGPVLKLTPINKKVGVLLGGRGGWIINHTFVVGGGAYGLVSNIAADAPGPGGEPYIDFSYGGLELEYISDWKSLLHLSFGLLIGGGQVRNRYANGAASGDERGFFTLEPWIHGNLNVTSFFRISTGVSYRWVTGAHSQVASDNGLSGAAGILVLRFGSF